MRSRVVFPAPFAPSSATASPCPTSRFISRKAAEVGRANGCRSARQPLCVGGNHFSSEETEIAEGGTEKFITCLVPEHNRWRPNAKISQAGRVSAVLQPSRTKTLEMAA